MIDNVYGKLNGTAFGKSFWKNFLLNPDNNINTPMYGMKGREVLAGKKVESASIPAGIPAFQEALLKYYSKQQAARVGVEWPEYGGWASAPALCRGLPHEPVSKLD